MSIELLSEHSGETSFQQELINVKLLQLSKAHLNLISSIFDSMCVV